METVWLCSTDDCRHAKILTSTYLQKLQKNDSFSPPPLFQGKGLCYQYKYSGTYRLDLHNSRIQQFRQIEFINVHLSANKEHALININLSKCYFMPFCWLRTSKYFRKGSRYGCFGPISRENLWKLRSSLPCLIIICFVAARSKVMISGEKQHLLRFLSARNFILPKILFHSFVEETLLFQNK